MDTPHPTRIFKTADELLQAWESYKVYKDAEGKKWTKVQYVGKDGIRVEDNPPMPYDMDGFFTWYKNTHGRQIHQYFDGTYDYGEDFLGIVTHIIAERNDNIRTGTLLGFFNASMGNRIVGLSEKTQTEISIEQSPFKSLSLDVPTDNGTN